MREFALERLTEWSLMRGVKERAYAKSFDGLIIQHAEEPELSQGYSIEGATRMGLTGIPNYSESMVIERRDLWLVRDTM